jgi:hypothetical protein
LPDARKIRRNQTLDSNVAHRWSDFEFFSKLLKPAPAPAPSPTPTPTSDLAALAATTARPALRFADLYARPPV